LCVCVCMRACVYVCVCVCVCAGVNHWLLASRSPPSIIVVLFRALAHCRRAACCSRARPQRWRRRSQVPSRSHAGNAREHARGLYAVAERASVRERALRRPQRDRPLTQQARGDDLRSLQKRVTQPHPCMTPKKVPKKVIFNSYKQYIKKVMTFIGCTRSFSRNVSQSKGHSRCMISSIG
jgi:hypothetical protein